MCKKTNGYVKLTQKQYDELKLAIAYAIIRSDMAYSAVNKNNRSIENVAKK